MDQIGKYIISILCAAVICGIFTSFVPKDRSYGGIIRMLCGLFVAVTVIHPLTKLQFEKWDYYIEGIGVDAQAAAQIGVQSAKNETDAIIKDQLEAYILDKAASMGVSVSAMITLTEESPPRPYALEISGAVSPYAKGILTDCIVHELGISEEQIIWK